MIGAVTDATDRRPGRPRDARVDSAVLAATIAEVTERGFGGATIDGIAARAGVGKATIYRRWPNKEAVLQYVGAQLTDTCESIDSGDLRTDLLSIFEPLAEQFRGGGPIATLMPGLIAEAAHDESIREMVGRLAADRRSGAVDAIERARKRGELRRGTDANAVIDMIAGSFLYRTMLLGEVLPDDFAATIVDMALEGVRKP